MNLKNSNLRKIYAVIMSLCLAAAFTACKNSKEEHSDVNSSEISVSDSSENNNSQKDIVFSESANEKTVETESDCSISENQSETQTKTQTEKNNSEKEVLQSETSAPDFSASDNSAPYISEPDTANLNASDSKKSEDKMDYSAYISMTSDDQYSFYKSFETPESFLEWYNAAKDEYEKTHPQKVLNPGDVIDCE